MSGDMLKGSLGSCCGSEVMHWESGIGYHGSGDMLDRLVHCLPIPTVAKTAIWRKWQTDKEMRDDVKERETKCTQIHFCA